MKQPAKNRQTQKTHTKNTRTNHHRFYPTNLKYHGNYYPLPTTENTHQLNPPHHPFRPSQPAKTNNIDNQPLIPKNP